LVASSFIGLQNAEIVCNQLAVMSTKEALLEGLRDLEQREMPGTAMAQLRQIKDEIKALRTKGYTQKQVWSSLKKQGLELTFSGFKTFLYRMQEEVDRSQKVSKSLKKCPHCGSEIVGVASAVDEQAGAASATGVETLVQPTEQSANVNERGESMGSVFAQRLEDGSLKKGFGGGDRRSDSGSN
jgi:hypothetical protein